MVGRPSETKPAGQTGPEQAPRAEAVESLLHPPKENLHDSTTARIRQDLAASGIDLDDLLNAQRYINLTKEFDIMVGQREALVAAGFDDEDKDVSKLSKQIEDARVALLREKRQVMKLWLKQLFVLQAIGFAILGGLLANSTALSSTFPMFSVQIPLAGQALGFWMVWLFSIPALRARKGIKKREKSALNVAFLATPALNLLLPLATKNCGLIWASNLIVLTGAYAYYGAFNEAQKARESLDRATDNTADGLMETPKEQAAIKGLLKYLDWGSWR